MKYTLPQYALLALRKVISRRFNPAAYQNSCEGSIADAQQASDTIAQLLQSGQPCMIARYGATELTLVRNYVGIKNRALSITPPRNIGILF
jgi:hypothetical protein